MCVKLLDEAGYQVERYLVRGKLTRVISMIVGGGKKQGSLFGRKKASTLAGPQPKQSASSPANSDAAAVPTRAFGSGCCRQLGDCMSMDSIAPPTKLKQQQQQQLQLEQQVVDLEREVEKQKELRIMYKKRMERTQDYLRFCLQIAQDHGILDLIIGNKDNHINTICGSPNSSPDQLFPASSQQHVHCHSELATLTKQARLNGWYIHPQEIELQEKIGKGSTADIYKGVWRGLDVAVKCIFPDFFRFNESGVSFFVQELDTLSRQRYRFILQLVGASLDPPNHAWVVTEYLGTTLKEWLHGAGNRNMARSSPLPPLTDRLARAVEIALAMQYLHEQKPSKVIHRDLKPSNIFLDDANHVRVADFGHARFLNHQEMALTGETGTYVYMAPEVIACHPYNEKCDVYSFGIILNEILTGDYPYIDTHLGPSEIAMQVADGNLRPKLPKDEDGQLVELIDLICVSWDQDPSLRPSFTTITSTIKEIQRTITSQTTQALDL